VDWERKGGPQLVEAFKRVRQVHPDAQLTIVGCSPQVDVPNCHVIGRVPKEEVARYYTEASVFCLPTRREPFGFVFIEAMAYGLPIVATNIAAIPDFVTPGETGYMVEPDDVRGLAYALIELIGDPEKCRAFGAKGYRVSKAHYSWDNVVRIMQNSIYAAIAAPQIDAPPPTANNGSSPSGDATWQRPRLQTSG